MSAVGMQRTAITPEFTTPRYERIQTISWPAETAETNSASSWAALARARCASLRMVDQAQRPGATYGAMPALAQGAVEYAGVRGSGSLCLNNRERLELESESDGGTAGSNGRGIATPSQSVELETSSSSGERSASPGSAVWPKRSGMTSRATCERPGNSSLFPTMSRETMMPPRPPLADGVPQLPAHKVLGAAEEDARLSVVLETLALFALDVRPGATAEHAQGRVVGLALVHHLVGCPARWD
jgi:hypothetical protein